MENYFGVLYKILKYTGSINLNGQKGPLAKLYTFSVAVCLFLQLTSNLVHLYQKWNDFNSAVNTSSIAIVFFVAGSVFLAFIMHTNYWKKLITYLEDTIENYQVLYSVETYKKTFITKLSENKLTEILTISVSASGAIIWWIAAVVKGNYTLPFQNSWYPFDMRKYHFYLFIWQIYTSALMNIHWNLVSITILKVIWKITEMFRMLEHSLRNMTETEFNEELILMKLKKCIAFHIRIIRSCEMLQDAFAINLLIMYFFTTTGLCFGAYVIISSNQIDETFLSMVSYISLVFVAMFILCWFVEGIISVANTIPSAIYSMQWHKFTTKTKKIVLVMLRRSQINPTFSAGYLLRFSIDCLTDILKMSFSYYTFLKSMALQRH